MCRCWLNVGVLLAFVLAALTHVSPASATAVILTPPADLRLQTPGLAPWGSPGDAAAPKRVMHPLLAEILAGVGGALVSVPLTLLVGTVSAAIPRTCWWQLCRR